MYVDNTYLEIVKLKEHSVINIFGNKMWLIESAEERERR